MAMVNYMARLIEHRLSEEAALWFGQTRRAPF
jgi:hypothetical protein